MKTRMLSLLIAAALSGASAQAAEPAAAPAAKPAAPTAQQQAARAEIDRLVERIQELSKQLGDGSDVKVIVRRMDGPGGMHQRMRHEGMRHDGMHGPGAMPHEGMMDMDEDVMFERVGGPGGDGERKIRIQRMGPEGMKRPGFAPGPGIGIVMSPNTAATGVRIAAVTPDSPAQKADLRAGDVLLSVDGKPVGAGGAQALQKARELLGDLKKGQVVQLRIAREGKTVDARVTADDIGRVVMFNRGEGMHRMPGGDMHRRTMMLPPKVAMEIERVGPGGECRHGGKDCGMPALFQAFRWQGLNLASLDADLGRYFGTDKGVLVIDAGPEMKGLRSGDVIQRVGGAAVESPREVMRALRDKDEGAQLKLDVLRDRKPAAVTLTVPKSRPLPFMAPPAPPAPPTPPPAPSARTPAPPAAPGAPPRAPRAAPPAPPTPPPAPEAMRWQDEDGAEVVEVRSVDEDGNEQVERVVTVSREG